MAGLIPTQNRTFGANPRFFSFYNMLDDFFSDSLQSTKSFYNDTFKLDVCDRDGEYAIEAELPGVKRDEIELSADEGRFTISVQRTAESAEEKGGYIHKERRTSSMARSVYLADADVDNVSAKLENGILCIRVPKLTPVETKKQIEIQ